MKLRRLLIISMSLVMILSIPLTFLGEGKILANEREEEKLLANVFENLEYVYDENGEFLGIYEDSLSDLQGTDYEYIISDLDREGYLFSQNDIALRSGNPQHEAIINAREAVTSNPEARNILTSCIAENFGPSLGEDFVRQLLQADYRAAVKTLGNMGIKSTLPGLIATYGQCLYKAQANT